MKKEIVKNEMSISKTLTKKILFIQDNILKVRVIDEVFDDEKDDYVKTIAEVELDEIVEHNNCFEIIYINPFWNVELRHVLIRKSEVEDKKILDFLINQKIKKIQK